MTGQEPAGKEMIRKAGELQAVADELGCGMAKLAIAWCVKNPNVSTVILGASKLSQLEENLKALELLPKLNDQVVDRIEAIVENKPREPIDFQKS